MKHHKTKKDLIVPVQAGLMRAGKSRHAAVPMSYSMQGQGSKMGRMSGQMPQPQSAPDPVDNGIGDSAATTSGGPSGGMGSGGGDAIGS